MTTNGRPIARLRIVLGIAAVGLLTLVASVGWSEAKPKKQAVSQQCTCGCEYQDAEGKWQWGNDVSFTSSDCHQWRNKKQSCMTGDGLSDGGRLTMCMPVQKDAEAPAGGGNAGVDAGASSQPAGTVGGPDFGMQLHLSPGN
jgi:hypothetical protein